MDASPDRVARIQAEWRRERPELDTSPQGVIGRLHRVAALLTEELVAVYGRYGLNEGDFDVLATLRRSGAPYARAAGELADHTMITTGGLTKRVDRLVAKGLVERRPGSADARQRIVALTPRGSRRSMRRSRRTWRTSIGSSLRSAARTRRDSNCSWSGGFASSATTEPSDD